MANLNYYPVTSEEWLKQKLATIEPILRQRLSEEAAGRGLDPNDPIVLKQIEDKIDEYRQNYMSQQSEYAFKESEAEKDRKAQERMADKQAKAQERGSMWQGLGNLGGMALFSGKDNILSKGVSSGFNALKSAYNTPRTEISYTPSNTATSDTAMFKTLGTSPSSNLDFGNKSLSLFDKNYGFNKNTQSNVEFTTKSDYLTKGAPALGSLAGWLVNKGKGASQAGWLGGLSSMASTSPYAGIGTFLGSALAPKEGLFKKSSHFGKSLLSTLGSTTPIWGRLLGLF